MPRLIAPLLIALAAALVAVAPAAARGGPCTSAAGSPHCTYWTGKVKFVADGDTIDVDIAGDGTHAKRPIRITGLNALELRRYSKYPNRRRGECHGVAAADRIDHLLHLGHRRVRLAAQHASSRSGHRLRRQVSTRIGGRWVDVAAVELAEGHALWLPNGEEWAWNRQYEALSKAARAKRLRLWNPRGCGAGPARSVELPMFLKYDADGNDFDNVNGEWARIVNPGSTSLSLARWYFRDSALRRYTFPHGARIRAGGDVVVHMGRGHSGDGVFYWGLPTPPFENPSYDERGIGDGAYLFDPRGNLRASVIYP